MKMASSSFTGWGQRSQPLNAFIIRVHPCPSVVARPFSGAFPAPRIQVDMIATGLLHALWLVLPPSAQIATR